MTDSILTSTKKALGVGATDTSFDLDIMMHINSAFSTLHQLGIGPEEGYMIEDATATWSTFIQGDPRLNSVKTYTYASVRLLFDPPTTSYHLTSLQEMKKELEWRLNVQREATAWVSPEPLPEDRYEDILILDGGTP